MNKKNIYAGFIFFFELFVSVVLIIGYINQTAPIVLFSIIFGIVGYYMYLRYKKYEIISSLYNMIPGIGSVYLLTYPILKYILKLLPSQIKAVTDESVIKTTFLGGYFLLLYCALSVLNQKKIKSAEDDSTDSVYFGDFYHQIGISINNILFDAVFFVFFVVSIFLYRQIGGFRAVISGVSTRSIVGKTYSEISAYGYIEYAFIGYTIYSLFAFRNHKVDNFNKLITYFRAVFIIVYWILQVLVGNRRSFIYVLMGLLLYYSSSKKQYNKSYLIKRFLIFLGGLTLIVLLLYISVLRNNNALAPEIQLRDMFGEFIYPMVTCYFYVGSSSYSYLYGLSFFLIFVILIPRSIWSSKPLSLSNQFAIDYNTKMGYAYTPYTELYRNFGFFSPLFGLLIYHPMFLFITKKRNKYPLFYLVLYIEIVNFFRGEFATTFVELVIIYTTIKLMYFINNNHSIIKSHKGIINESQSKNKIII